MKPLYSTISYPEYQAGMLGTHIIPWASCMTVLTADFLRQEHLGCKQSILLLFLLFLFSF
jgi:hypothetical protein